MRDTGAEQPGTHHTVRLRYRLGAAQLDLAFVLTAPWTILFGPSGSGKTTILRVIAGLVRPDEALIRRHGPSPEHAAELLTDTRAAGAIPAHKRLIGFAPQQPSLFPHKTVLQNVLFGIGSGGRAVDTATNRRTVEPILAMLRIAALADKYPAQLSGGEAHRVNLARAFATAHAPVPRQSRLFLLDEPFTGLELELRDRIIADVRQWLRSQRIPVLSVTHDVGEAFQIGADVIKIANGRIAEQGPVEVVLRTEKERLIAQLNGHTAELLSPEPHRTS